MNSRRRTIAEMLKAARERKGLSGRAIARLSGKPNSYIHKVESGQVSPTVETLAELCPYYGLEPWEAVAGLTRAELLAQLPVTPRDPLYAELDDLVRTHGADTVRALLLAARELPDPEAFKAAVRVFKALQSQGG
jgi:transcriptional regulator with XRE-family HTH domain